MATRPNFFDLTKDLAFDPPEKNGRKVKAAVDAFKEDINVKLRGDIGQVERTKLNGLLAEVDRVMAAGSDAYLEEAKQKKDAAVRSLRANVAIAVKAGEKTVTTGKIKALRKSTMLSEDTIKTVYQEAGFEIYSPDTRSKLPALLDPVVLGEVSRNLEGLHMEKGPDIADRRQVKDLFGFAAYLEGNLANAADYSSQGTERLMNIFKTKQTDYTTRNDALGHILSALCSKGATQVFNSDENRKRYCNSLAYDTLSELFSNIKLATESDRSSPRFAEQCIAQISRVFPDYETALAIYNREAGLFDNPYEPEQYDAVRIVCLCGVAARFKSLAEAQRAKCPTCGADLYRPCPKCGKLVPAGLQYCPENSCGFFIAGAKNFGLYYQAAVDALERYDLAEAQTQLSRARAAQPNEPRLPALESRVKQALGEYEKPLSEIRSLIGAKKFKAAEKAIAQIRAKQPRLELSSFESAVRVNLDKADRLYASSRGLSAAKRAEMCIEILNECADYEAAVAYLAETPPAPCPAIEARADAAHGVCHIAWQPPGDPGVRYTVVRKRGGIPSSFSDGTAVAEDIVVNACEDTGPEPGVLYGYAVFVRRYGAVSRGTGATAIIFQEISEASLKVVAGDGQCRATWEIPANCIGVCVTRRSGGIPPLGGGADVAVVSASAQRSFEDTRLQNGQLYGYRLQALYAGERGQIASEGIVFTVQPERKPEGLTLSCKKTPGACRLEWEPKQAGFDVRLVVLKPNAAVQKGQAYSDAQIRALGETAAVENSDRGYCPVEFKAGMVCDIAAFIVFGNQGLASNTVTVNTYPSCEFDKARKPFMYRDSLIFSLQTPLPAGLRNIYYAVNKWAGQGAAIPWATAADTQRMSRMAAADYMSRGEIEVPCISGEGDYFITVIASYAAGGGEVFAPPAKKRFSFSTPAGIEYGVKVQRALFSRKVESASLWVRFTASASACTLPQLVLCCGADNAMLTSATERGAIRLLTTSEVPLRPNECTTLQFPIDPRLISTVPPGTFVSLFLLDEELADDYRIGLLDRFTGVIPD